jgi:hypothetical protein
VILHVYGVVRADRRLPERLRGLRGAAVDLVTHDDLAAVVSPVAEDHEHGEDDAREHLAVLTALVGEGPVLPLRLGTVAPDEVAVATEVLGAPGSELRRDLDAVAGLVEVHVDVADDEHERLREIVREAPDLPSFHEGSRAGRSLDYRVRVGRLVADRLAERRAAEAEDLLARLGPLAVADAPRAAADGWVMRRAFLLRQADVARFDEALDAVHAHYAGTRSVTRVGPLPVFSFGRVPDSSRSRWGW